MAASQARSAFGTQLQREDTGVYTEVPELTSISGPAQKGKAIDVTNMDSPLAFSEYIAGIVDGGQIQIEGNWTGVAEQIGVLTDFQTRVVTNWKLLLPGTQPGAGYWTFSGYVIDHSMDFKVDDRITWKATVQITGKPLFATA